MKFTYLQGEIDKSIIVEGDLNILLSVIDRWGRQKFGKDIEQFNNIINRLDLLDIHTHIHRLAPTN